MGYFIAGCATFFITGYGWVASLIIWTCGICKFCGDHAGELTGRQWEYAYRNSLRQWGCTDSYCDREARIFATKMCKNAYHKNYYIPTKEEQDAIARKYGCHPEKVNIDYNHLASIIIKKYYLWDYSTARSTDDDIAKRENISIDIVKKVIPICDSLVIAKNKEREKKKWENGFLEENLE